MLIEIVIIIFIDKSF